jgi:uncharacterized membrane protein (DUF373 family)
MNNYLKNFEKYIFYFLIAILAIYILVEVVTLVYFFFTGLFTIESGNVLFFSKDEGEQIIPAFFGILIALELIDTFKIYLKEHEIKAQHIIIIGIIAVSRKLLVIDFAHGEAMANISIAALIVGLALAYFLLKKGAVH